MRYLKGIQHSGSRYFTSKIKLLWYTVSRDKNDYLQNRNQYVSYDKTKSDMYHLSTGVSQGSILGSLLVIIYVNDLCNDVNCSK